MTEIEEIRAEVAGLRQLTEGLLRESCGRQPHHPKQYFDELSVDGLSRINRRFADDPLRERIRRKLIEIVLGARS